MTKALLTYDEAAEYLGVGLKTLRRMVAARRISVVRLSHKIARFRRCDLDGFIEEHVIPALED